MMSGKTWATTDCAQAGGNEAGESDGESEGDMAEAQAVSDMAYQISMLAVDGRVQEENDE